jgi:hypothetical protein
MGGIVHAVEDAIGGAVDAVGSALGAVTGGISSAVGDLADAAGLPSQVGDALENFADIGLGGLTGGIGGAIGDAAGFLDPLGFFGNAAGDIGGLATDLLPGLGNVFGAIGDSGFPFADMLGGAAENLIGSNGILSGIVGGPASLLAGLLPSFDPSKLLPSVLNGAGSVLQNLFNQLPQLGNIPGGTNPLAALSDLSRFAQDLNPSDVLNALKDGLLKLAGNFPSPSKQLNDVLSMLANLSKGEIDPRSLLQDVSSRLGSIPELNVPMMPFNPADMLGIAGFANQFLGSFGQPPLPPAFVGQVGPQVLESAGQGIANLDPRKLPIEAPIGSIRPEILAVLPNLTAVTGGPGDVAAPAAQTPSGEQALIGALEKNMDSINDIMNQLANLDPESKDYQKNMMQLQMKMQQLQQMQMMISEMLKNINELKETIIRNLGA